MQCRKRKQHAFQVRSHNPCFIGIILAICHRYAPKSFIKSHNPCFIGIILAIGTAEIIIGDLDGSQSLFYWNNPCNLQYSFIKYGENKSQSLFYWNNPCNIKEL